METEHKEDGVNVLFMINVLNVMRQRYQTLYIRRIAPLKYDTCVTQRDTFVTVRHNYEEK